MYSRAARLVASKPLALLLCLFSATAAASAPLSEGGVARSADAALVSAPASVPLSTSPAAAAAAWSNSGSSTFALPGARHFGPLLGYAGQLGPASLDPAPVSAMTTASIAPVKTTTARAAELFGAHRIRFGKIGSGARVAAQIRKATADDAAALCADRCAALADHLGREGASDDARQRLVRVSAEVNRLIRYRSDESLHGEMDRWSLGDETLARGAGDCEDYAILKMGLLARLGVPLGAMEIVVVKDTGRRLFHAVLSVSLDGENLILDNMSDAVVSDREKPDYAPLFSIASRANYVFGYAAGQSRQVASIGDALTVAPGAGF